MKSAILKLLSMLVIGFMAFVLPGCGGSGGGGENPPAEVTLQSIDVQTYLPYPASGTVSTYALDGGQAELALVDLPRRFIAIGHYSDGSTRIVSKEVDWTSTDESVMRFSGKYDENGYAIFEVLKEGTADVIAEKGDVKTEKPMQVKQGTLELRVALEKGSVPVGVQTQLKAEVAAYVDGVYLHPIDVSNEVSWDSNDTNVAHVLQKGDFFFAEGISVGEASIVASYGKLSTSRPLKVTSAELVGLVVTPKNETVPALTELQMSAEGVFTDGQKYPTKVTWRSENETVATVDANGLVTTHSTGEAKITATSEVNGSITDTAKITVRALAFESVTVTPKTTSVPAGGTVQMTATGNFETGYTKDLTGYVGTSWTSSDPAKAIVDDNGVVRSLSTGTVTITASTTINGVTHTDSATIEMRQLAFESLTVTPKTTSVPAGGTVQMTATGNFETGYTKDLTSYVGTGWATSDPNKATVDANGLVTTVGTGDVTITATTTVNGVTKTDTATIHVEQLDFESVTVTPKHTSVPVMGNFEKGYTKDLTSYVGTSYVSSDTSVATVDANGLVTTVGTGDVTITATTTVNGVTHSDTTTINAVARTFDALIVTPVDPSTPAGSTVQLTATGDFQGYMKDLTSYVNTSWSTSDASVAT